MNRAFIFFAAIMTIFTFILILLIALINQTTFATSLWRGIISAGIMLLISLVSTSFIFNNIFNQMEAQPKLAKNNDRHYEKSEEEFKMGYEYLLKNFSQSQIDQNIVSKLESDPQRATELLKKMKAE